MSRRCCILSLLILFAGISFGAEWVNVVPESKVGGRVASCGYLKGKVVLLDVRDYSDEADQSAMKQLQNLWVAYKSKPFVLLGSHIGSGDKAEASNLVKKLHLSYSIYSNVALKNDSGENVSFACGIYIFDSTGRRIFFGKDVRQAMGVVGSAIFSACIPSSPKHWKDVLDYEIANLPGQAYLRIRDLKTNHKDVLKELAVAFPDDVKRYAEKWREYGDDSEIKKLAKLVETAKLVKDRDKTSRASQRLRASALENVIRQYSALTKSENPIIAQEAKNSIAELKFVQAELKR